VLLDPTYTGKAMAALIGDVRAGRVAPDDTLVFLHTGGAPALFAHAALFD
jgi:1-aminocyclopropane-1-carboxylate deaminase/D-cysteine desulfhydrase-like pyridoxal-dependent ACC family enzyme